MLPINAFLLMAEEPVLVDTGTGDGQPTSSSTRVARSSPFDEIKWVWLTHDDADHTGSIQTVMELAPNAKLVTHGLCALRMAPGGRSRWSGCTRSGPATTCTSVTGR